MRIIQHRDAQAPELVIEVLDFTQGDFKNNLNLMGKRMGKVHVPSDMMFDFFKSELFEIIKPYMTVMRVHCRPMFMPIIGDKMLRELVKKSRPV